MHPAEARRIAKAANGIAGWFSADVAALLALLDAVQREDGVAGDLFEIGVRHGRSAVLLCSMAGPGETVGRLRPLRATGAQRLGLRLGRPGDIKARPDRRP